MKQPGQIELTCGTGLMFCLGYGLGDGELQDSFRESLTIRLVVEVHSWLFLATQIQEEDFMDDLPKFLMLLLKPSFLRQHKTDFEQYPLEPTSTAKSSTDHPLGSIVAFKGKYLLILVLCHDLMFSAQGHVNSMSITFLKMLEKIVISGLS